MILGIDSSTILETREAGARYFVSGEEVEPISYMHDHNGVSLLRLRLWMNPYDEQGRPYGGGTVDYPSFVKMAKEGMEKGYKILLDFHYSDFWCDPSKQFLPKAWRDFTIDQAVEGIYEYTKKTLTDIQKDGIVLDSVQIGNEITNGMLWPLGKLTPNPDGKRGNYESLIRLLKAGVKAAREVMPKTRIIIHLEKSGDQATYREFFDEVSAAKLDFDIIGVSFYPYWHGTFDMVFDNIDAVKARYHKPVWIVETSYGFTTKASTHLHETFVPLLSDNLLSQDNVYAPYPITLEGQLAFTKELFKRAKEHDVGAIIWWEPFWLPLAGLTWATKIGEEYTHETDKPTNNEWANQCLFDYEGNATPAFFAYKI